MSQVSIPVGVPEPPVTDAVNTKLLPAVTEPSSATVTVATAPAARVPDPVKVPDAVPFVVGDTYQVAFHVPSSWTDQVSGPVLGVP